MLKEHIIYVQKNGKFCLFQPARGNTSNRNFIIQYKGKDWSCFLPLAECTDLFDILEKRKDANEDNFAVVER